MLREARGISPLPLVFACYHRDIVHFDATKKDWWNWRWNNSFRINISCHHDTTANIWYDYRSKCNIRCDVYNCHRCIYDRYVADNIYH